jgi:hypothetical protein
LWRYTYDIQNTWNNVYSIINYTVNHQEEIAKHAGPGHWNDPDMVLTFYINFIFTITNQMEY